MTRGQLNPRGVQEQENLTEIYIKYKIYYMDITSSQQIVESQQRTPSRLRRSLYHLGLGALAQAGIILSTMGVYYTMDAYSGSADSEERSHVEQYMIPSTSKLLWECVATPIWEELLFRGLVQPVIEE